MVNMISGWINPAYQQGQSRGRSMLIDTIVMVALGALAYAGAANFDYNSPGLALLLRCVPVGLSLVWLFKYCRPSQWSNQQYVPVVIQQSPAPPPQNYWNWGNSWSWGNWGSPALRAAPVTRQHQPVVVPVYNQPTPFPAVVPAPAQPYYRPAPPVHAPVAPAPFPAVRPAPAQPPQYHATPIQVPVAPAPFPLVQPAPAQPTVQRVNVQTNIPAPVVRPAFPNVQAAAPTSAAPATRPHPPAAPHPTMNAAPQGRGGNDRMMFAASETR